jgi:N-carbamoylputrescine amidase
MLLLLLKRIGNSFLMSGEYKMAKLVSVALIQESLIQSKQENREKLEAHIKEASKNAQLLVLSELHDGAYFCQSEDPAVFSLAEPIPGEGSKFYAALAKKYSTVLVSSHFEKRGAGVYHNTALVHDKDGSLAGMYRKMHIPDDPGYYEKYYFTPGDLGITPIETSLGKLGVLICWDQWFPEAARLMALAGAEILIYPTAIGYDPNDTEDEKQRQLDSWITIQRSHAIANSCFVISANRTGFEAPGIEFWGNSFIAGPQGEILVQANQEFTGALHADVDLNRIETTRRIWPFLRDRRIDSYSELDKRLL